MNTNKIKLRFKLWLEKFFIKRLCKLNNILDENRLHIIFTVVGLVKIVVISFLNDSEKQEFKNYIEVKTFGLTLIHFKFYTEKRLSFSYSGSLYN